MSWELAAIVEVDHADRVQCECKGCGHTIYKRIHLIAWSDGRIECWGSECYARELGSTPEGKDRRSLFGTAAGRRLTQEERQWLAANREKLLAWFRAEWDREAQAQRDREEAARRQAAEQRPREEVERDPAERAALDLLRSYADPVSPENPPPPPRLVPDGPSPPPSRGEPMHDPAYREIRALLERQWRANGVDPNSNHGRRTLIENALHRYRQRAGVPRR